jgi:hypothetical protein
VFAARAGVAEQRRTRRRRAFVREGTALAVSLALGLSAACQGDGSAPETLLDGSDAVATGLELDNVSGKLVQTRVRATLARDVRTGSLAAACLGINAGETPPAGLVVERIGVSGETVTFRDASGLRACDDSDGPREADRRWCGGAFGRLDRGRLRDPRLDIGCRSADGDPIAFVWVEPDPRTRFVAVRQPGYVEVYRSAGGLPVRVSSVDGVSLERSSASVDVSEHDRGGNLIREYGIDAAVAG